jgi:prevent-host-death family protein
MSTQTVAQFNMHEAKSNLSKLIERVEAGEEIIICRAGRPTAKLVALTGVVRRTSRGTVPDLVASPDWDSAAVNQAIATDFGLGP